MPSRLDVLLEFVRRELIERLGRFVAALVGTIRALSEAAWRRRGRIVAAALLALLAYGLYAHPPFATVRRGEWVVRTNVLDGSANVYSAGTVLVLPGLQQLRRYSTRDQVYRPSESVSAGGAAPFQSIEGLSLGIDLAVRWTVDPARLAQLSKDSPDDLNDDLVRPAVQGVIFPLFARYTVREIFSSRRAEIQQELVTQLKPKLAMLGLVLRGVDIGKVDLPRDYRAGLERVLAEELETEKIRYTLELKEAQVKQGQLEAEAEQRKLEAEAEKVARIRNAEGAAEARRIEAKGEADSRQKLADAEAYRLELVGKANAGQMEREGALISHYPLLIQKTLADKLSDKVQVIIAPTPAAGRFIGSNLIGTPASASPDDAENSQ
jgi:regulator of protease activity HflC (stomatin/prohibitin superfamily)